jgi:hypothetical protein
VLTAGLRENKGISSTLAIVHLKSDIKMTTMRKGHDAGDDTYLQHEILNDPKWSAYAPDKRIVSRE